MTPRRLVPTRSLALPVAAGTLALAALVAGVPDTRAQRVALAAEPPAAANGPATLDAAAAQEPLADGEWRVSWCASCVGSMAVAADGVWYGTIDGLAFLDAASGEVTGYGVPKSLVDRSIWFPFSPAAVEPTGAVWGTVRDADERRTVARFDGSTWRTFNAADGLPDAEPGYRMAVDVGGGVWMTTYGAGAARFDGTSWTRFGTADGLPSDDVRDVAVAQDGTVWLATSAGLAAYDGASWSSITAPDGLPAPGARAIDVGPDGALWVGLWDADQPGAAMHRGLGRWSGGAWGVATSADGLPGDHVYGVAFGHDGTPWANTERGIARLDGARWQPVSDADGFAGPVDGRGTIASSPEGGLWFGGFDEGPGLARLDPDGWTPYFAAMGPMGSEVVGVRRGPDGAMWLAYANNGRFRLNRVVEGVWDALVSEAFEAPTSGVGTVTLGRAAMAFDRMGRLAISSIHQRQGIATYDRRDDSWSRWPRPIDLPGTLVNDVAFDAQGIAWYATDDGVASIDGDALRTFGHADGLPSAYVNAIAVDRDGVVWAGTTSGVARWDGDANGWTPFAIAPGYDVSVRWLVVAPDGTVWAGSAQRVAGDGGRYVLSAFRGGSWSVIERYERLEALAIAPDGELWVAGDDRMGRLAMGRWTWYDAPEDIALTGVNDLAIAGDGTLWMAGVVEGAYAVVRFRPPEGDRTPRVYLPWVGW